MIAYKFLARGAVGPISRVRWPLPAGAGQPGAWLEIDGPLAVCRAGVHACRTDQLAYWLHEELWRVELEGPPAPGLDCVVSPRGRLVEEVGAWSGGGAQRFAAAVRDHAARAIDARPDSERAGLRGYVDDASWHVKNGFLQSPALAALCSAMGAAKAGEKATCAPEAESFTSTEILEREYRRERAWQSEWIVNEMRLT